MVLLVCFVAQTFHYLTSNCARVGDNVVFVWEPGNPFHHSYVKFGLLRESCVYIFGHLEATLVSIIYPLINPLGTLVENQDKCCVFFHIYQLLRHICYITMSRH